MLGGLAASTLAQSNAAEHDVDRRDPLQRVRPLLPPARGARHADCREVMKPKGLSVALAFHQRDNARRAGWQAVPSRGTRPRRADGGSSGSLPRPVRPGSDGGGPGRGAGGTRRPVRPSWAGRTARLGVKGAPGDLSGACPRVGVVPTSPRESPGAERPRGRAAHAGRPGPRTRGRRRGGVRRRGRRRTLGAQGDGGPYTFRRLRAPSGLALHGSGVVLWDSSTHPALPSPLELQLLPVPRRPYLVNDSGAGRVGANG